MTPLTFDLTLTNDAETDDEWERRYDRNDPFAVIIYNWRSAFTPDTADALRDWMNELPDGGAAVTAEMTSARAAARPDQPILAEVARAMHAYEAHLRDIADPDPDPKAADPVDLSSLTLSEIF